MPSRSQRFISPKFSTWKRPTGALFALALLVGISGTAKADLLGYNTAGNLGTELSEPVSQAVAHLTATDLFVGPGINPAANGNRLGGSGFAGSEALAITGNDYFQFTITPESGYSLQASQLRFIFDFSGTGPNSVSLRSSVDGFAANLATASTLTASTTNYTTLNFSLNSTGAVTFRLYAYGASNTAGTAGFDTSTGNTTPNVTLAVNLSPLTIAGTSPLVVPEPNMALCLIPILGVLVYRERKSLASLLQLTA